MPGAPTYSSGMSSTVRCGRPPYQPVGREPDDYTAAFFEDRAEFTRRDGPLVTATDIIVSPEHDAEVRRVSITNTENRAHE